MGFFIKDPAEKYEREAYKQVAQEMLNNQVDTGLLAKLFSESRGNTGKAEARYIKQRSKEVASEMHGQALHTEQVKKDKEAEASAKIWWWVFQVAGCGWAGYWVHGETGSLPLGIAYLIFLAALPSLWLIGGRFSIAYTASAISSLVLLIVGRAEFSMGMGQAFFWGGLVTNAVLFAAFLWISYKITSR